MGMAIGLARENGIELQMAKAAREMFKRAMDGGRAKDGPSASLKSMRERPQGNHAPSHCADRWIGG